jgi:S-adenosyl-L-homocysteine hydrolase
MAIQNSVACLASAILALSVTVPAQAACWHADAVAAAKVRDLETMLMVSALRCRNSGSDFLAAYNEFVRSSRAALGIANNRLRDHFTIGWGTKGGLDAYDRYVTSLANRHGGGTKGHNCETMASVNTAAIRNGANFDALEALATRADVHPVLVGGPCPVLIARAP